MKACNRPKVERTLSKLRIAYDMMEIITTSIDVAKRELVKVELVTNPTNDQADSLRADLKIVEYDILSIKKDIANMISDQTDLLNTFNKEN